MAGVFRTGNPFLSTLSLRRATRLIYRYGYGRGHFYPRSPCGERHLQPGYLALIHSISIHALLAESDSLRPCMPTAPPCISIHALLAESDRDGHEHRTNIILTFLSTLSLRRATLGSIQSSTMIVFLSTLSLRRATFSGSAWVQEFPISIHALLAESDCARGPPRGKAPRFLSTLSLRRATAVITTCPPLPSYFYPRSPCGERRCWCWGYPLPCQISIHALLAESDFKPCNHIGCHIISIHALLAESDC